MLPDEFPWNICLTDFSKIHLLVSVQDSQSDRYISLHYESVHKHLTAYLVLLEDENSRVVNRLVMIVDQRP